MQPVIRDTKQVWVDRFDAFLNFCFQIISRKLSTELVRRSTERGNGALQWLTPVESSVAEALANLIVPPDDDTPGIEDVGVLGPTALESLDRLIENSPERQALYSRGLLAFDVWSQKEHGCLFASMSHEDQIRLVKASEHIYEDWISPAPLVQKAWRRFKIVIREKGVPFSTAQLFPQIRNDCLQIFYTSRVSWLWLGYDGPPMDEGYPQLKARTES
jgi:hypothetical protein